MSEGQLIFDMWANEANQRLHVYALPNGGLRFVTIDVTDWNDIKPVHTVTLTAYRAADLCDRLSGRKEKRDDE